MSLQQITQLTERANSLTDFSRSSAAPLEDMVLKEGGPRSIKTVMNDLASAQQQSGAAMDNAASIYERQTRGLGQRQTDSAARSAQRRLGLSRALVAVDSRNRAVQGMRDRTDIARSSAADLRSVVERNAYDAEISAANMATDREVQYQQDLAKYKQDKAAGLGQLASMASMFIPGVGPLVAPMIGQAVTKAAM